MKPPALPGVISLQEYKPNMGQGSSSDSCPLLLVPINKGEIVNRNAYVAYERSEIIGRTSIDKRDAEKARRWNRAIDTKLSEQRKQWVLVPPSNMTITVHEDAGAISSGLVLSMPHEVGRVVLSRRLGSIIERDMTVDAVIDGSLEEAVEAMGIGLP
jgi:hypothetical protein